MPLFEVDTQRPLLVTSANGSEPGLKTTANQVVDSHIDGLLGEEVFPIAQGSGPDEPHLLALDASGSPVVVELVADLDRENLAKALDHAGAAGRLTRADLAARYSGGASSFQHDVAAFYDSVPITRTQSGKNGGSGARLIIICQNAPDEILNAVDFLRQPTMPVEVLKMGVVNSDDGRKFLDVSPLVVHLPPGLPATKSAPIGGSITSSMGGPVSSSMDTGVTGGVVGGSAAPKDAFEEGVKVGYALTGKMPVVAQSPQTRSPQAPLSRAERARKTPVRAAAPPPPPLADNPSAGPTNAATGLRSSLRGAAPRGTPERAVDGGSPERAAGDGTPERTSERTADGGRRERAAGGGAAERAAGGGTPERAAGTRAARRAQAAAAGPDAVPPAPSEPGSGSLPSAPVSSVRPGAESRPTPSTPPRLAASRSSLGDAAVPVRTEPAAEPAPATRRRSRTDRFAASAQQEDPTSAYPPSAPTPGSSYPPPPAPQPPVEENLWQPPSYDAAPASRAGSNEPTDFDATQPRYTPEPPYGAGSSFAPAAPSYGYPPEPAAGYGDQNGYGYGEQPGYESPYQDNAAPAAAEPNPWESGGYLAGPDDGYGQPAFVADPYQSSAPEAPARPVPPSESIRASTPMLFEEEDDPDLEALARSVGTPTRIVWSRPRRNQHFEAMLLPDGAIELANGARYRHPDTAATAASGSYTADGWNVWRIGDTGPTLVEEFSRRFA
ncbi:hypothetical protein APR04_002466 [Promicromonospora umidemergens]|uniref:RAMA domain-containing protein n=1 Tax=Promicromonospora umidemergens TaxID=629679 RepID=A0ABP8WUC3_9MICO|nr:hypothetical protein [Promicromonospora umidemergens]MCP2283558.1 hypothetical protein [Promicromonospora umidemergens]